jgi:hypothetical protein
VTDCSPAWKLVVTMGNKGLVLDLTLALVAAKVKPRPGHQQRVAGGSPRTASQGEGNDRLGGADAGAATGEPGTRATQGP